MAGDSVPSALRPSLRQEYEEFILQRIEEYKEQLSRAELLSLGDEAVKELESASEGQLVLTEVLMLDHVDRLIRKRLHLPSYRRWRDGHLRRRQAQRQLTHWGLSPDSPLPGLLSRCRQGSIALVVGARAAPAGFLIAAHDVPVLVIDHDLSGVEAAESRAAAESLGTRFQALVVALGGWFPDLVTPLVVLEPEAVLSLGEEMRRRLMTTLQDHTAPGGVHLALPVAAHGMSVPAVPADLAAHYAEWRTEAPPRAHWLLAEKPGESTDRPT